MRVRLPLALSALALMLLPFTPASGHDRGDETSAAAQLGPRPFYLVQGMDEGWLKDRLLSCAGGPFRKTDFTIAHRGAPLMFPEHSDVSYRAGARMGAGVVECDVTFTRDGQLVCRHSECDLATTTDVVATSLNDRCTVPWTGPVGPNPAPVCCTSDLTLAEFKTLRPKMDASTPGATTPEGFLGGTAESIELNERMGVKHTPELKSATHPERVEAIFGGQPQYAQALVDELRAARVDPRNVFVQSFHLDDVRYWIARAPQLGRQAVYLDAVDPTVSPPIPRLTIAELRQRRSTCSPAT